ncbi:MAG: hypothetical protein K8T90_05720 [Planctomycetes bacterium]|nr:hypothetical protein [Planctomycetota bacterium]
MRISVLATRLWIFALRFVPQRFHTKETRAALRVTQLDDARRAELARNLRSMLRPKAAA